jgi:hypothetical protein
VGRLYETGDQCACTAMTLLYSVQSSFPWHGQWERVEGSIDFFVTRVLSLPLEEDPSSTNRVTWGKNARHDDTPRRLRLLALARIPQGRAWLGPCGARNDLYSPPPWLGRLNEKHIILDYLLDLPVVLRSLDNLLRKMIGRSSRPRSARARHGWIIDLYSLHNSTHTIRAP